MRRLLLILTLLVLGGLLASLLVLPVEAAPRAPRPTPTPTEVITIYWGRYLASDGSVVKQGFTDTFYDWCPDPWHEMPLLSCYANP